jgi:hypothetical protein
VRLRHPGRPHRQSRRTRRTRRLHRTASLVAGTPNGVALGELPGAEQVELDSAGDVPDGGFAGPGADCPRVDAWPLVTVPQAPGRGGNGPECGRRSARCIRGHDRSGSRPGSGCRHQLPVGPAGFFL